MPLDYAVASVFSAAVDTEDSHVKAVYREGQGSDNDKDVSDDRFLLDSPAMKEIAFNARPVALKWVILIFFDNVFLALVATVAADPPLRDPDLSS